MINIYRWPRWIQGGLLSIAAAAVFAFVGGRFESLPIARVFKLGALAPTMLILNLSVSLNTLYAVAFAWWFLIGAVLGTFIDRSEIAVVIWLAVLFSGAWIFYLLLNT